MAPPKSKSSSQASYMLTLEQRFVGSRMQLEPAQPRPRRQQVIPQSQTVNIFDRLNVASGTTRQTTRRGSQVPSRGQMDFSANERHPSDRQINVRTTMPPAEGSAVPIMVEGAFPSNMEQSHHHQQHLQVSTSLQAPFVNPNNAGATTSDDRDGQTNRESQLSWPLSANNSYPVTPISAVSRSPQIDEHQFITAGNQTGLSLPFALQMAFGQPTIDGSGHSAVTGEAPRPMHSSNSQHVDTANAHHIPNIAYTSTNAGNSCAHVGEVVLAYKALCLHCGAIRVVEIHSEPDAQNHTAHHQSHASLHFSNIPGEVSQQQVPVVSNDTNAWVESRGYTFMEGSSPDGLGHPGPSSSNIEPSRDRLPQYPRIEIPDMSYRGPESEFSATTSPFRSPAILPTPASASFPPAASPLDDPFDAWIQTILQN